MIIDGYEFKGIINGFTLDETLINFKNEISDIDKQILCVSKKKLKGNASKYIDIDSLLLKKNLSYYEKFLVLLESYLLNNPDCIVFKNLFCDFSNDELKDLVLLFRDLKKKKVCKFIICSKNSDIILSLCDYVIDESGSGKTIAVYKSKKNNLPFCIKFAKEFEECKGKKIGIYRDNIPDLAKDVYRYVE